MIGEDPVKRLAWLRADCDAVRALLAQMPEEWFQERGELAIRIEEHEREIAALVDRTEACLARLRSRDPLPPADLVEALQDRLENATGAVRAGKSARSP